MSTLCCTVFIERYWKLRYHLKMLKDIWILWLRPNQLESPLSFMDTLVCTMTFSFLGSEMHSYYLFNFNYFMWFFRELLSTFSLLVSMDNVELKCYSWYFPPQTGFPFSAQKNNAAQILKVVVGRNLCSDFRK